MAIEDKVISETVLKICFCSSCVSLLAISDVLSLLFWTDLFIDIQSLHLKTDIKLSCLIEIYLTWVIMLSYRRDKGHQILHIFVSKSLLKISWRVKEFVVSTKHMSISKSFLSMTQQSATTVTASNCWFRGVGNQTASDWSCVHPWSLFIPQPLVRTLELTELGEALDSVHLLFFLSLPLQSPREIA